MQKPYKVAFSNLVRDTTTTISNFKGLQDFIQKNRLWSGILQYSWLSKFLLIIGIVGGLAFIHFVYDYWSHKAEIDTLSLASLGSAMGGFFIEGYDLFVIGGLKYVILILMEVVIFHFARRTLEIKTGKTLDTSLKAFIKAQKRMFQVVIYSFVMETICSIIVGTGLGIIGFSMLKPAFVLMIQGYFLGFAVIDNYNEIYHMKIKQSAQYTMQYGSVAITIGLVVYVIMLVPLIGAVLGPLIGAVVATLTMHELHERDQNMAWVFVEKEKKQNIPT